MATPKIAWGSSFANTWTWPSPGDNPRPDKKVQGAHGESQSGVRTAWVTREDATLRITARFIPKATAGAVTGFTASTGVLDALAWMWGNSGTATAQSQFRFYPDKDSGTYHTCVLVEEPEHERDIGGSHYTVRLHMRDTSGTAFTEY